MVPHPVLLEEVSPVLDGAPDRQQDGAAHAHLPVLLNDLSSVTGGRLHHYTQKTFTFFQAVIFYSVKVPNFMNTFDIFCDVLLL